MRKTGLLGENIGVLLSQIGTPDSPQCRDVRTYLKHFLSDPRIVPMNRFVWQVLLNCFILPFRTRKSAELYQRIWTDEGSPLRVITEKQTSLVAAKLRDTDPRLSVQFGMHYGNPSLTKALESMLSLGCRKIILLPLYPQYSATTWGSAYDVVLRHLGDVQAHRLVKVSSPFFDHPSFLSATAHLINNHLPQLPSQPERLILSYHGLPMALIDSGDPYADHCEATTKSLIPLLNFDSSKVIHAYQSRFGRGKWLSPSTLDILSSLAEQGVKSVAVAFPGFTADCLETLEEIRRSAAQYFCAQGGEVLHAIPCLNDHPVWISALADIISEQTHGFANG